MYSLGFQGAYSPASINNRNCLPEPDLVCRWELDQLLKKAENKEKGLAWSNMKCEHFPETANIWRIWSVFLYHRFPFPYPLVFSAQIMYLQMCSALEEL